MGKALNLLLPAALVALGAAPALANDWSKQVATLIAKQHNYPRSAQLRGDEGTAKVRVSIDASGRIANVELIEKSGSDILDREAIRMPSKVGAVPPPPGAKPAAVVVPITWKLS